MEAVTTNPVLGTPFLDALLALLTGVGPGPVIASPAVTLVTAGPPAILPSWVVDDFTPATFTGSAPQVWAPGAAPINPVSALGRAKGGNNVFTNTVLIPDGGQSIIGYYISGEEDLPVLAEYFPNPIPIVSPGDFIDLFSFIQLDFQPVGG